MKELKELKFSQQASVVVHHVQTLEADCNQLPKMKRIDFLKFLHNPFNIFNSFVVPIHLCR